MDAALAEIPEQLVRSGRELRALIIEEEPPTTSWRDVLGYYDGTPLSERDSQYSGVLPDRILIFRGPLLRLVSQRARVGRRGAHHGAGTRSPISSASTTTNSTISATPEP